MTTKATEAIYNTTENPGGVLASTGAGTVDDPIVPAVATIGRDGVSVATVKAASTGPAATDTSFVVALSPNSTLVGMKDSGGTDITDAAAHNLKVADAALLTALTGLSYETVAASQTDQVMGTTGAIGDRLTGIAFTPASTSPGAVSVKDGGGSAITVFAGGSSSVADLTPFFLSFGPLGAQSAAGAWKVTTGANVSVIAVGRFT